MGKNSLRWNTVATLITLAVMLSLGARFIPHWGESAAFAQEHPPAASESASANEHDDQQEHGAAEEHGILGEVAHWFNFVLIVGGIGYLGKKFAAPFFAQRSQAIREEMERSASAMAEASQRLSEIEDKLRRLDEEIQGLRRASLEEAAADRARLAEGTKAEAAKIVSAAEQEIAAAAKAARRELKIYTADLAVDLAQKRIQESITPAAEKRILHSFMEDLRDHSRRSGSSAAPKEM
ncbi:MAG: ATP synthase F0 subunit B [Acidobacteria bacterium]|nr:ATP synthase F0 subunit B [Acidobacteriota bacterium]